MADKVKFVLEVDSKGAITSMKKFESNTITSTNKMKQSFLTLNNVMKATAVVAIAGVILKMKSLISETIEYADLLHKTNLRLGVSVQSLDKFRKIAALSGVEFSKLTMAFSTMAVNLDMARKETGIASEALDEMNLSINDLVNLSPEEQFLIIAESLMKIESASLRGAKAQALFGGASKKLLSMLPNLRKMYEETSSAFTLERVTVLADFNDTMQMFRDILKDIVITYLPPLIVYLNELQPLFQKISESLNFSLDPIEKQITDITEELKNQTRELERRKQMIANTGDIFGMKASGLREQQKLVDALESKLKVLNDLQRVQGDVKKSKELAEQAAEAKVQLVESEKILLELQEKAAQKSLFLLQTKARWQAEFRQKELEGIQIQEDQKHKTILAVEQDLLNKKRSFREADANSMAQWEEYKQGIADESFEKQAALQEKLNYMIAEDMSDAMMEVIDGTKSFEEAFSDMAKSVTTQLLKMIIMYAILSAFSGKKMSMEGFGNFSLGSAKGNAFNNGSVVPYAQGGIVSSPTLFPMAKGTGLMGEAGPEGILPLKRNAAGDLGVISSGGEGGVTNNNTTIQAMDSKSFTDFARRNPDAFSAVMNDMANKGNSGFKNAVKKAGR